MNQRRSLVVLLSFAIACDASVRDAGAPSTSGGSEPDANAGASSSTCTPTEHVTQESVGGPDEPGKSLQRYRFVGSSADGTRVAVVFSHFGPSSGAPFANLGVFELGKETSIFSDGRFMLGGAEEADLASVESALLNATRAKLDELGVMTSELPSPLPWCGTNGSLFLGGPAPVSATFGLGQGTCPIDGAALTTWSVCTRTERCADGMRLEVKEATQCEDSRDVTFVDAAIASDVIWFVAERKVRGVDEDYIREREVGALRLAP